MSNNRASTKVMENIGLEKEGTLKQHIVKDGLFKDIDVYGTVK